MNFPLSPIRDCFLTLAVAALALAATPARSQVISGGDFQLFKPGSTTVTAELVGGGYVPWSPPAAPTNLTVLGGSAAYSDSTTGTTVDLLGWSKIQGDVTLFGNGPGGSMALNCYAAWGGDTRVETTGSLHTITAGETITISVDVSGGPGGPMSGPLAFHLYANGSLVTPSSSVNVSGEASKTISRTYDPAALAGHIGATTKIVLGVEDANDEGNRVIFDNVTLVTSVPDTTPPTLAAIVDDKGGGRVAVNTLVNYTVTFSEDMDASTVDATDFGNADSSTITIGTVTEITPGVFTVQVTPTSGGTLQLEVNAGAVLKDAAGNSLVTTSAIADDTILAVILPAVIATHPASVTINSGSTATLTVVASGTEPFFYRWYQGVSGDFSTPVGTDSASFTTPVLTATTSYWVNVINGADPLGVDSNTATVTVSPPATVFTWITATSGNWSDASNWTNDQSSGTAPIATGQADYTLNFNSAGTYTATNDLNAGFLLNRLNFGGSAVTLAGNGLLFFTNGATLPQLNQNAASAVTISAPLSLAADLTVGGTGSATVSLSGVIAGTGGLIKTSPGTLNLVGANTYSGGTTVQGGTLVVTGAGTLGAATGVLTVDGTSARVVISLPPTPRTVGTVNLLNGGQITGPSTLSAAAFNVESGTISARLAGTGGLTKTTTATVTLSAANTYTGDTTVNAGTLALSTAPDPLNANPGNDASKVTIAATGAALNLTYTGTDKVDKLFIGTTQMAAGVYGAGNLSQITGSGTLTITSGPTPGGYASWQAANGTTGGFGEDHDNDGTLNGIEYFLGGTFNTTGITPLPGETNTAGTYSVTWTKAANGYPGTYGTDFWVETSATSTGPWMPEGSNVVISGPDVTYTFPAPGTNFVRLFINGPDPGPGGGVAYTPPLTVGQPTQIATHPASTTINSGGTATLAVVASGTEPITYQWFEGITSITTTPVGTNSASFTTPALSTTTNYWVKVTNAANSIGANSNTATVTVSAASPPNTFSVNFYVGPDFPYGGLTTDEQKANVRVAPGVPAGLGDWYTSGWLNFLVPWSPTAPLAPVTLTSNQGSTATFTFKDCRNGWTYSGPRTTLLGDGNGNMMDAHLNSTLDPGDGSNLFDMEVTGIPFAVYDVIFYVGANAAQFGDGTGVIKFNGGAERAFTLKPGAFDGTFTEMIDATTQGNYIVFRGVTGTSFTTQTWGTGPGGFNHIGPNGFQIREATVTGADYDSWTAANAGGQAPDLDFDADGRTNKFEYAFGLNATLNTSVNPVTVPFNRSAGTFSYTRRAQELSGLAYTVETSTDLIGWTAQPLAALMVTLFGDVETVMVTLPPFALPLLKGIRVVVSGTELFTPPYPFAIFTQTAAIASTTFNLGAVGSGTTIPDGGSIAWLAPGALPPGSLLQSVSIHARLDHTLVETWASNLNVVVGGALQIGSDGGGADWANGQNFVIGTTVIDTKTAGIDFPATIDLNTTGLALMNTWGDATWSGTVTVTYDAPIAADILTFGLPGNPAVITGTNIALTVPYGTDVTVLAPDYTLSPGATCDHDSGTEYDFTAPVVYTVLAEDLTTKAYTVTVTVAAAVPAAIATHPASVTINSGETATLTVTASGTAPFTYQWYQGASGTTATPVGTSSNSFTTPALSTTTSYWVKVTNAANPTGANSNTAMVTINQPPLVTTGPVNWNTGSMSPNPTLTGTVNPNGLATTAAFEYGLTTAYGNKLWPGLSPNSGWSAQNVSYTITYILPEGTYHYRLTATNAGGKTNGDDHIFVTARVSGDYTYTTADNTATITGYTGAGGTLLIPNTLNGLTVVGIGYRAFYYNANLTNVAIPASVTSIGSDAFSGCTGLTSVILSASITSIGSYPFSGCTGLTAITMDAANASYSSLDGVLFNKALTTLIQYPGGKAGSYTIPASVTSIGSYAFSGCTGLTSVTLPASVTSSGICPFRGCTGLTAITVDADNANYSSVNGVLFNTALTTLIQYPGAKAGAYTIPPSVTSIGVQAFVYCMGLTSVTVNAGITSIDTYAFSGCSGLTSVTLPASVTSIAYGAFYGCSRLTSVTLPASVTSIAGYAFNYCTALKSAFFAGSAPTMASDVFPNTAAGFSIYYLTGKAGFTTPTWQGYPAVALSSNPGIVTHPASVTINSGGTATLTVTAIGTDPLTYQWYQGTSGTTTTPVGTNSASFTTPALSTTTSYWVKVTNAANPTGANSNTATVTVNYPIPVENFSFELPNLRGDAAPSEQWSVDAPPAWTAVAQIPGPSDTAVGVTDSTNSMYSNSNGPVLPGTADGAQLGYMNLDYGNLDFSNTFTYSGFSLGTFVQGATYKLTVALGGRRQGSLPSTFRIDLLANGARVGSGTSATAVMDTFFDVNYSFTATAAEAGKPIGIQIFAAKAASSIFAQANFDNVRLTTSAPGSNAKILAFGLPGNSAIINGSNISLAVPYGTNVTSLAPTFILAAGARCDTPSGTVQDFNTPQAYTVTSADGLVTTVYTVTVVVGPTWTDDASGLWSTASNWSGGIVASGSGGTADFNSANLTADRTVSLDSPRTIGNLTFGDIATASAAGWIVNNNGSPANILTLAGESPTITVNALGTGKDATLSAELAGTAGLTKTGPGTLTLTHANSYAGNTVIDEGVLRLGGTNGSVGGGNIINNGTLAFNHPGAFTLSNIVFGTGGLRQEGPGTVLLAGDKFFTGATMVTGGTLAIASDLQLGTAPISPTTGKIVLSGGGKLTVSDSGTTLHVNRGMTLNGGGGILEATGTNNLIYRGRVTGTGGLTLSMLGTGEGQFGNVGSDYSGGTTIAAGSKLVIFNDSTGSATTGNLTAGNFGTGTLVMNTTSIRPTTAGTRTVGNAITLQGNLTMQTTPSGTSTSLTFNGPVTLTGATRSIANNANTATALLTFSGAIGDSGSNRGLTFNSTTGRIVVLSGSNTYTGRTTVASGTLRVGNGGLPGGSDVTLVGGILDLAGANPTAKSLTVTGLNAVIDFGSVSSSNTLRFTNGATAGWTGNVSLRNFNPATDTVYCGSSAAGIANNISRIKLVNPVGYPAGSYSLMAGADGKLSLAEQTAGDFRYTSYGPSAIITGYSGPGGELTIPNQLNGLPVTAIGASAFANNLSVTSVTIPATVTNIGDAAFAGCTNLVSALFLGSAPTMGTGVFASTAAGFSVYFFDGRAGFSSPTWPGYPAVNLGSPAPAVTTNTASGITGTSATLTGTVNPHGFATTARFEYGLTDSYGSIATVTLSPADGSTIQTVAADLTGLQPGQIYHYRITASNSEGPSVGADMTLMTAVPFTYANTGGTITLTEFTGTGDEVHIPVMIYGLPVTRVGGFAFHNLGNVIRVTLPASVTVIDDFAFASCRNLAAIILPDGLTRIGDFAFYDCGSLTDLTLPGSVTDIGDYAFALCDNLAHLTLGESLARIGEGAFFFCEKLTQVVIPSSVIQLGESAFEDCSRLTNATFLGNAPARGAWVFEATAASFAVHHFDGAAGFAAPGWQDQPAVNMGTATPLATWLIDQSLPFNANLQDDANGDGVNLLMAYALGLDPQQNLSGSMPQPVIAAAQMSLTFFAGRTDVTYFVQSSTDLATWTDEALSAPDAGHRRTATVPLTAPGCYLRIVARVP